jgi:hypothetical protein
MKHGAEPDIPASAPVDSDNLDWFTVSDVERKRLAAFAQKHPYGHGPAMDFTLRFTATGVGTRLIVRCQGCNEEADVSDYESW